MVAAVSMESSLLKEVGQSGPWAVMFGYLMVWMLKAWTSDRQQLLYVYTELKSSLDSFKAVLEQMNDRLARIERIEERKE